MHRQAISYYETTWHVAGSSTASSWQLCHFKRCQVYEWGIMHPGDFAL